MCYFEVMLHSGAFSEGSVIYCLFLPWHWDNTLPLCSSLSEAGGEEKSKKRGDGKREENRMDRVEKL